MRKLAEHFSFEALAISKESDYSIGNYANNYMLLTKNKKLINTEAMQEAITKKEEQTDNIKLWTDDYSNLFQILK